MTYSEKLRDPRWQKRRLQIMERDEFCCQYCYDSESTLCVHHRYYQGEPWEAPDEALVTLCEFCHQKETDQWQMEANALIREIKRHFNASEVSTLADGFRHALVGPMPEFTAEAVYLALTDWETQRLLIEQVIERNRHRGQASA